MRDSHLGCQQRVKVGGQARHQGPRHDLGRHPDAQLHLPPRRRKLQGSDDSPRSTEGRWARHE